jgi:hypothetical protein
MLQSHVHMLLCCPCIAGSRVFSIGDRKIVISNATPQPVLVKVTRSEQILKTLQEKRRQDVGKTDSLKATQKGQRNTTGHTGSHQHDATEDKQEVDTNKVRLDPYRIRELVVQGGPAVHTCAARACPAAVIHTYTHCATQYSEFCPCMGSGGMLLVCVTLAKPVWCLSFCSTL